MEGGQRGKREGSEITYRVESGQGLMAFTARNQRAKISAEMAVDEAGVDLGKKMG